MSAVDHAQLATTCRVHLAALGGLGYLALLKEAQEDIVRSTCELLQFHEDIADQWEEQQDALYDYYENDIDCRRCRKRQRADFARWMEQNYPNVAKGKTVGSYLDSRRVRALVCNECRWISDQISLFKTYERKIECRVCRRRKRTEFDEWLIRKTPEVNAGWFVLTYFPTREGRFVPCRASGHMNCRYQK